MGFTVLPHFVTSPRENLPDSRTILHKQSLALPIQTFIPSRHIILCHLIGLQTQDNWNWLTYLCPPMFPVLGNDITAHQVTRITGVTVTLPLSFSLHSLHSTSLTLSPLSQSCFCWPWLRLSSLFFPLGPLLGLSKWALIHFIPIQVCSIIFMLNIIVCLLNARCRVLDAGCIKLIKIDNRWSVLNL